MKLIETYEVTDSTGTIVEWAKIERAQDEFIWMPKADYDRLEEEQSTAKVPGK